MEFLRKYGVATEVYVPLIKAGAQDFALAADFTHAAGDTKISKDGGAAANITTAPVAIAMGNAAIWEVALSATEMQAANIVVTISDAATKAVEDQGIVISTYGNASAEHAFDLDLAEQTVDAVKISGDAAAADNLEAGLETVVVFSVGVGSTSTVIETNLTEATNDHYIGRSVFFRTGALAGQALSVTDYNGTTKQVTVLNQTADAPANGDLAVIL